ncbi:MULTISPECIES: hypothetical protein [unclassified Streptomyces]|uniref:hypothetical protein n=1 Tax=unclassified Streptomyces TaxID=2593676 RepID=UPI001F42CB60|nr:hypothetical protein [Streptomyces sp. CB01373]
MGGSSWNVPGAAPSLFVVGGTPLLHPEAQVFETMLAGWRDQQLARNLAKSNDRGSSGSGAPLSAVHQ